MFDNLRESAESSFYEEEPTELDQATAAQAARRRRNGRFLGMTPFQRFLISVMFLFAICIVGTLAMFVLGKMSFF